MGMSSYVFDSEEKMFDVIEQAIGNCEHLTDVMAEAVKQRKLVPHWSVQEIEDCCSEAWEEYWASKIQENTMIALIGYMVVANFVVSIFQVDTSCICVIVNSKLNVWRETNELFTRT